MAIFALFLVLIIVMWGALNLPFVRTALKNSVVSSFNEQFQGELGIGEVEGWIPFGLSFQDISLTIPQKGKAPDSILTAERLYVNLNIWSLWRKKLSVVRLELDKPTFYVSKTDSVWNVARAFSPDTPDSSSDRRNPIPKIPIELYAPELFIRDGCLSWKFDQEIKTSNIQFPETGTYHRIEAQFFFEYVDDHLYTDIFAFQAESEQHPDIKLFKAQGYIDNKFIELNGLKLYTEQSKFEGFIKILRPDSSIRDVYDLLKNQVELQIETLEINPNEWAPYVPSFKSWKSNLKTSVNIKGNTNQLIVSYLKLDYADVSFETYAEINQLDQVKELSYLVDIQNLTFKPSSLQPWISFPNSFELIKNKPFTIRGKTSGTFEENHFDLHFTQAEAKGNATLRGLIIANELTTFTDYDLQLELNNLDAEKWLGIKNTKPLNADFTVVGSGFNPDLIQAQLIAKLNRPGYEFFSADSIFLKASIDKRLIDWELKLDKSLTTLDLKGSFFANDSLPKYDLSGSFKNVNLQDWLLTTTAPKTQLDGKLTVDGSGLKPDDIFGLVSLDITHAIVNSDTLAPHQFYADLDGPKSNERHFRVTSSLFDLDIKGPIFPTKWARWFENWSSVVEKQFAELYLLEEQDSLAIANPVFTENQRVELDFVSKNVGLINAYFAEVPLIKVASQASMNIEIENGGLVTTGEWISDSLVLGQSTLKNSVLAFTATVKNLNNLRQNASVIIKAEAGELRMGENQFEDVQFLFEQQEDSVHASILIKNITRFGSVDLDLTARLSDSSIDAQIQRLSVGNPAYMWRGDATGLALDSSGALHLNELIFRNQEQSIYLNGSLSNSNTDSMIYKIQDLNLGQISELLNLQYQLSGTIDGSFQTKTLSSVPQFEGIISIDDIRMGGRPVGNASISSRYEPSQDRFDASISILLDSTTHPDYWKQSKRGNQFDIKGYIYRPDVNFRASDTLYAFQIDLPKADMWILNYFIPQIYSKIEGSATGEGYITGGLGWFDFSTKFNLNKLLTVPKFLNTNFYMTGPITFGYHEGVVFDSLLITDGLGGSGILDGLIYMDYFGPNRSYDLKLDISRLQFLNNRFSSEVPFYGKVAGTGSLKLSGSISKPFLETLGPVQTTANSRLSVPLIDKTKVESQTRFIEFVVSFDERLVSRNATVQAQNGRKQSQNGTTPSSQANKKTFTELFQLNLQFRAPNDTQFELVFDPVTGEILTARGGGSLNITLEDEELKMYGFFDVLGGDYNFVGGDLFTRRFILNDGGTLSWEGAPHNPRVNLTTVYRSRPNMQPITGQDVRVPVDLILKLSGSIEALQNDFYFEIPNTTFQDASLNTALRLLNSEDQKLPQATSLLLTGNFFAVNAAGTENSFGNNLQNNATQAGLSQLLSNQINSILNNSISNLDIDLNLNGFDQADLGIALRLFDDRLVLRREGQILNNQPNGVNQNLIGDLGASFKISRALSVEVFYRQDPTLGGFSAVQDQAQNVSGVGLQYQVQFNRWYDLPKIVWNNIKDFFGFGSKKKQDLAASKG